MNSDTLSSSDCGYFWCKFWENFLPHWALYFCPITLSDYITVLVSSFLLWWLILHFYTCPGMWFGTKVVKNLNPGLPSSPCLTMLIVWWCSVVLTYVSIYVSLSFLRSLLATGRSGQKATHRGRRKRRRRGRARLSRRFRVQQQKMQNWTAHRDPGHHYSSHW